MRQLAIAAAIVASTITFAQMASAAPPSPPAYGWTGWYIGLNAGGNWGGDSVSTGESNRQNCDLVLYCKNASNTANASIDGATGTFPVKTDGFIGGGQFGYNWQFANRWVAGFEADIQGLAGADGSNVTSSTYAVSGFSGAAVATNVSVTKSIDFLATVRGRLGYLVKPRLLVFGTGGFAFGHVESSTTISHNLSAAFSGVATSIGADLSVSKMLNGWTIGGGFEWMFASHWTAKVEYLYYDLGSVTSYGQIADPYTIPRPPATYYFVNDVQSTTRFNGNIVRVGLNYQF